MAGAGRGRGLGREPRGRRWAMERDADTDGTRVWLRSEWLRTEGTRIGGGEVREGEAKGFRRIATATEGTRTGQDSALGRLTGRSSGQGTRQVEEGQWVTGRGSG